MIPKFQKYYNNSDNELLEYEFMAIHFACAQCNKALFAQDQFAGRVATCPVCQKRNLIPGASSSGVVEEVKPSAAHVLATQQSVAMVEPAKAVPIAEKSEHCPNCGERVKPNAIKCRFCGVILNEELSTLAVKEIVELVERSANRWRVVARFFTLFTAGWLLFLLTGDFQNMPATLSVFDALLIFGLIWSSRQMRFGPHQVFATAALTVLICMPLNLLLGLPLPERETFRLQIADQMKDELKNLDPAKAQEMIEYQMTYAFVMLSAMIGGIFSLPIWIASFKVSALNRLRSRLPGLYKS